MLSRVILCCVLAAPSLALATPIAFEPPAELRLFESVRLLDVRGKVKGSCEEAVAAALENAAARAEKKDHPVLVAVYDDRPDEDWTSATEVTCVAKGAETQVDLKALAVRPGADERYAMMSGARMAEIIGRVTDDGTAGRIPINSLIIEPFSEWVFLKIDRFPEPNFGADVQLTERGMLAFREAISDKMPELGHRIDGLYEISGVLVELTVRIREHGDQVEGVASDVGGQSEIAERVEQWRFYFPALGVVQFGAGETSERALFEKSVVLRAYEGKLSEIDLLPRTSELLTGH